MDSMRTIVLLLISVALPSTPHLAASDGSCQHTPRGVLDVIVFFADAPADVQRYPSAVRRDCNGSSSAPAAIGRGSGRLDSDPRCE